MIYMNTFIFSQEKIIKTHHAKFTTSPHPTMISQLCNTKPQKPGYRTSPLPATARVHSCGKF